MKNYFYTSLIAFTSLTLITGVSMAETPKYWRIEQVEPTTSPILLLNGTGKVVFSDDATSDSSPVTVTSSSPTFTKPNFENLVAEAKLEPAVESASKPIVIASRSVGEDAYGADERELEQDQSQQKQQQQDQKQADQKQQEQMPPVAPDQNQQQGHAQQSPTQDQVQVPGPSQDQQQDQDQRQDRRQEQRQQRPVKRTYKATEILAQGEKQAKGFDVEACIDELHEAEFQNCSLSMSLDGESELGRRESWQAQRAYAKLQDSERGLLTLEKKTLAKKIWNKVTFWNMFKGKDTGMYDYSRCGKRVGEEAIRAATSSTAEQFCKSADMNHSVYNMRKHIQNTLDSIEKAIAATNPKNTTIIGALEALKTQWLALLRPNSPVVAAARSFDSRKDFDGKLNQNVVKRIPNMIIDSGKKAIDMTLHPSHILHPERRVARDPSTSAEFEKETSNSKNGKNLDGSDPSTLEYMLGERRAGRYNR